MSRRSIASANSGLQLIHADDYKPDYPTLWPQYFFLTVPLLRYRRERDNRATLDEAFRELAEDKIINHILMENRSRLVMDVETTQATGTAEREAAEKIAARTLKPGSTPGEDKGYDVASHLETLDAQGIGYQASYLFYS